MLFAITLRYLRPQEEIQAQLEAHKSWLVHHIKQENILTAGPLAAYDGGLLLAHGVDVAQIQTILAEDPFHLHQLVEFEITAFEPAIRSHHLPAHWAPNAKSI